MRTERTKCALLFAYLGERYENKERNDIQCDMQKRIYKGQRPCETI